MTSTLFVSSDVAILVLAGKSGSNFLSRGARTPPRCRVRLVCVSRVSHVRHEVDHVPRPDTGQGI